MRPDFRSRKNGFRLENFAVVGGSHVFPGLEQVESFLKLRSSCEVECTLQQGVRLVRVTTRRNVLLSFMIDHWIYCRVLLFLWYLRPDMSFDSDVADSSITALRRRHGGALLPCLCLAATNHVSNECCPLLFSDYCRAASPRFQERVLCHAAYGQR